jgi:hypothetical protein
MGVKFGREYTDIIHDFTRAMRDIDGINEFFEMNADEWSQLEQNEQYECIQTMADDVFYGLGAEPSVQVGQGTVVYDKSNHIIKVFSGENVVHVVNLV